MLRDSRSIIKVDELNINNETIYICKYVRNDFDEDEWQEFITYDDKLHESIYGEPSTTPYEVKRTWYTDTEVDAINHRWLVIKDQKLIGRAAISYYTPSSSSYEENKDTAEMYIDIHQDFRKRGYGTKLFEIVTHQLKSDNKNKIQSHYILECSARFCENHGFNIESARNISKLLKDDIDFNKVRDWSNISDRKIIFFNDAPEEYLDEYCRLYTACGRMAPDYDGDYTASEQITPKARRANEQQWKEKGLLLYTAVSVEADGTLSGMTEMDYFEKNPKHVDQGLTGVLKAYRGNKIGLQLKAALLEHVNQLNPEMAYIFTANNKKNVAMLAINDMLGFKACYDHYLVSKRI